MTHLQIVMKLIGEVRPVGMSHIDEQRLDNLKELCALASNINSEIENIAYNRFHNNEHSIVKCQEYAKNFLINWAKAINENLS